MNKLDELIEKRATEYFRSLGMPEGLIEYKVLDLKILAIRGVNTRAEILGLLKKVA